VTDEPKDQLVSIVAPERMWRFTWDDPNEIEIIKWGKQPEPDPELSPDDTSLQAPAEFPCRGRNQESIPTGRRC
jgi:hypothetical protein